MRARASCATCHPVENGRAGMDNLPTSPGARGEQGRRNSPTVLNAGWNETQFWDGRAEDLTEQAKQPILNPIEMGMPDEAFVFELTGDEDDQMLFRVPGLRNVALTAPYFHDGHRRRFPIPR